MILPLSTRLWSCNGFFKGKRKKQSTNTGYQQRNQCILSQSHFHPFTFPQERKRIWLAMTGMWGMHVDSRTHPLFSLIIHIPLVAFTVWSERIFQCYGPCLVPQLISARGHASAHALLLAITYLISAYLKIKGKNLRMCRRFSRDQTWEHEILTSLTPAKR